jgi:flagellar export protein FliJ
MAGKFQFRLEVVRDIRKRVRDEIARTVGAKASEATATRKRVDEIRQEIATTAADSRAHRQMRNLSLSELRIQQYYGKWLSDRSSAAAKDMQRVEKELRAERERLAQATARFKAIEKLRERKWDRHIQTLRREEQATMDEIAGRRSAIDQARGE